MLAVKRRSRIEKTRLDNVKKQQQFRPERNNDDCRSSNNEIDGLLEAKSNKPRMMNVSVNITTYC
jgi:hypothetical protein